MVNRSPALVSVVTPSFNQGKYIENAILSVKNQSYPNIEHIIIDGGSTDNTMDVLRKYEKTYNMKYISEPDDGQADALNKGFAMAKGEFIGWINSDDCYFDVDAISSAVEYFNKYLYYDVIYGDAINIDEDNRFMLMIKVRNFNYNFLKKACFIIQPAAFFRRCIIDKYKLNKELQCSMDYDLWMRIAKNHRFKHVNRIFAVDRVQKERKLITKRDISIKESLYVSPEYKNFNFVDRLINYPSYRLGFVFRLIGIKKIYYDYSPAFPLQLDDILTAIRRNISPPKN